MIRDLIGVYALGVGFALFVVTAAPGECPSDDVNDVLSDPAVQDALKDAWEDSDEGQFDEHEEGGFIFECVSVGPDGEVTYEYEIFRLPPGTRDSMKAVLPKVIRPECRVVASFHTHPGPEKGHPEDDGYHNEEPSTNDSIWANNHNIPGIVVYGTGPEYDPSKVFTYGPRQPLEDCEIPEPKKGETKGDPHLTTFDGFVYSFQAVGEYVLAVNGDIEVQVRFEPVSGSTVASNTTAVTVRLGSSVVMVHLNGRRWLDGRAVDRLPDQVGGVAIEQDGPDLRFLWRDGTVLTVSNLRLLLNVRIESLRFGWEGLFGDGDGDPGNDLVGINGPLEGRVDFEALYKELRPRWAVTDATSLFTYGPGESTSTFSDAAFPSAVVGFSDFPEAEVEAARVMCVDAMVWREPYLANCVYDFLVTGAPEVVDAAAAAHRQQFPITLVGAVDGSVQFEGSVAVEGGGEIFVVDGTPGSLVSLEFDSIREVDRCPRLTANFELLVLDMRGTEIAEVWPGNTGCLAYGPWAMPDDGRLALLVTSPDTEVAGQDPLRTGTFTVTIGAPNGRTQDVALTLDESTTVGGSITIPLDFVDYRVTGQPGDLVSVDFVSLNGIIDCGQEVWDARVSAFGAAGEELGNGWPGIEACRPYGGWEIPASGELVVRVHGGDGGVTTTTGTYTLEIGRYGYDVVPVERIDATRFGGEVTIALDGVLYEITAAPGTSIAARIVSMDGNVGCGIAQWDLRLIVSDNEGNAIADEWPGNFGCGEFGPWTVPTSGELLVLARGGDYSRFVPTGAFELEFVER